MICYVVRQLTQKLCLTHNFSSRPGSLKFKVATVPKTGFPEEFKENGLRNLVRKLTKVFRGAFLEMFLAPRLKALFVAHPKWPGYTVSFWRDICYMMQL